VGISPAPRTIRPLAARTTTALLAALLILTLPSCTDTPTTPPETPKSQAKAAYLAYWEMADRLAGQPDPDASEIDDLASGEALAHLKEGLTGLRDAGQTVEVGSRTSHSVADVRILDDGSARLDDCDVDDSRLVGPNGEVLDEGLTTTLWRVTMTKPDDDWRVDRFERLDAWEGEVDCT
jgi:hypothetical protein